MKRIVFLLSILCFCMSTAWGQYTHNKKAYKSHFTAEQQKMHNAHLKELKKSKRFATIEPFFPSSNAEFYYTFTLENGKNAPKGLLYTEFKDGKALFDTIVAPAKYNDFVIHARTKGNEPYYAINAAGNERRAIYFNHKHDETTIYAQYVDNQGVVYDDVYTVLCSPYLRVPEINNPFSHLLDATLDYLPGIIATGSEFSWEVAETIGERWHYSYHFGRSPGMYPKAGIEL